MAELPIVERLRERSLELQSTAWSRMDGGQECSLSATLVDETADTITALYEALDEIIGFGGLSIAKVEKAKAALSLALGEAPNA